MKQKPGANLGKVSEKLKVNGEGGNCRPIDSIRYIRPTGRRCNHARDLEKKIIKREGVANG